MTQITKFPISTKGIDSIAEILPENISSSDLHLVFDESENEWKKAKLISESKFNIYPTIEALQAADLYLDTVNPVYVKCEETSYRLYKIVDDAAGVDDIELDNGLVAQFQVEQLRFDERETGFDISHEAQPGGGDRIYKLSMGRNPGTAFSPLMTFSSISPDGLTTYFNVELATINSIDMASAPIKDVQSSITTAYGINFRTRLWVNTTTKTAKLHVVITGFATSSVETNVETISDNSDHGPDTLINQGSGIITSGAKLIVPLYSNQGFVINSIPAIVGALKIDANCNAWLNLTNGANFSPGQVITVEYKIK